MKCRVCVEGDWMVRGVGGVGKVVCGRSRGRVCGSMEEGGVWR